MIRILLIDDHKIIREGLRCLLEKSPDLRVVGDAQDGRSAIHLVKQGKSDPDLVITDIRMPKMDGIEVSRQILNEKPGVKIIVLTMLGDRQLVERSLQAGVNGYLLKGCSFSELMAAIRSVSNGDIYLSPEIQQDIVNRYLTRLQPEKSRSH